MLVYSINSYVLCCLWRLKCVLLVWKATENREKCSILTCKKTWVLYRFTVFFLQMWAAGATVNTCWSWHKLMWKWMTFSDQPSKSAFPKWGFQKRMLGLHLSDGLFWALLTTASMGWRELCFHTVWCVHHVLICSAHMGTSPLSCHGPGILCDLQLFLFGGCFPTVNQWADLAEFQAF